MVWRGEALKGKGEGKGVGGREKVGSRVWRGGGEKGGYRETSCRVTDLS